MSIWTPHLEAGERVLWSDSVSADLVKASLNRRRLIAGVTGLAGTILAALLIFRALESFFPAQALPPGAMNVFGPIYAAFGAAMAVYAVGCFMRLNPKPPAAAHFAVTDRRIIAAASSGKVVDTLPAAAFDGVRAIEISRATSLVVSRKDDEVEKNALLIQFLARPLEAKAVIEETFTPAGEAAQ